MSIYCYDWVERANISDTRKRMLQLIRSGVTNANRRRGNPYSMIGHYKTDSEYFAGGRPAHLYNKNCQETYEFVEEQILITLGKYLEKQRVSA